MNKDLISREALKKDIEENSIILKGVRVIEVDCAKVLIDNAPAVEIPTELCKGCRFLKDCETCEDKIRPQGEWIYDDLFNNWKCSECGKTPKTIGYVGNTDFMKEHFKFCNHCGAKMKGGAE